MLLLVLFDFLGSSIFENGGGEEYEIWLKCSEMSAI